MGSVVATHRSASARPFTGGRGRGCGDFSALRFLRLSSQLSLVSLPPPRRLASASLALRTPRNKELNVSSSDTRHRIKRRSTTTWHMRPDTTVDAMRGTTDARRERRTRTGRPRGGGRVTCELCLACDRRVRPSAERTRRVVCGCQLIVAMTIWA